MINAWKAYYQDFAKLLPIILLVFFFGVTLNYTLSFHFLPGYTFYDIKRILELLLLFEFVILFFIFPSLYKTSLSVLSSLSSLTVWIMKLFFIIGIISAALAPLPKMAFTEVALYFLLFNFALFIAGYSVKFDEKADALLLAAVLSSVIIYLFTIVQVYMSTIIHGSALAPYPSFMNQRFFVQYQIWTMPFIVLPVFIRKRFNSIINGLCYLAATIWWALTFGNGSKGALVALVVAFIVALIIFRKSIWPWFKIQLIPIVLGIGLFIVYFSIVKFLFPLHVSHRAISDLSNLSSMSGSISNRLYMWKHAVNLFLSHWLLGVGPLHYAYYPDKIGAHPHNALLLVAAEWGGLSCLAIVIVVIRGLFSWISGLSKEMESNVEPLLFKLALKFALMVSMLSGIFFSLVSGIIVTPLSQVMGALILGWMLGHYFQNKTLKAAKSCRYIAFILLMLFALVGIYFGVYSQISTLPKIEIRWLMKRGFQDSFNPRFWIQGWLR